MLDAREIHPLTDFLRNHKAHVTRLKETHAPEVLTVNGKAEPLPVIVVDSVNRTPTPNAPGVSAVLNSPAYTEFDVAEVRVHKPETPFKYQDKSTQMELLGFKLPVLIHMA